MEGTESYGSSRGANGAETTALHEYHGDQVGPAWLTRRKGDRVEMLSEHDGVAQV